MFREERPKTKDYATMAGGFAGNDQDPMRTGAKFVTPDSVFQVATGTFEYGVIIDAYPHIRCYRVLSPTRGSIRAFAISNASGNTAIGQNDVNMYQTGTSVFVWISQHVQEGVIVGAIPGPVFNGNLVIPPVLVTGSNVGLIEKPFQHLFKVPGFEGAGLGFVNYSAGAAIDTLPGDWGMINELGSGILASHLSTFVRAAENCGLFCFYLDHLLRLHAYNYELFTASSEHRIVNDESEVHDVHFRTKFPWEALGVGKQGVEVFDTKDGAWDSSSKGEGYYEPKKEDQTGLWRDVELRGYLGDMHRQVITTADAEYDSKPINLSDNENPAYAGLSEITRAGNGAVGIRSAKEIIFSKYALIPVPQQVKVPDDNVEGDWHKNYKASNELGSGPTVDDMEDFQWTPEELADMRPALLLDYMSWTFNFHKIENLIAHEKDWKVPEEHEKIQKWTLTRAYIEADKVTVLDGQYWADMPKSFDINIDSRIKGQKYYEAMSTLAMMDDGSVVIEDGWGSQIIMSRGGIQLCCAGDVTLRPGRNLVSFAPGDTVFRSGGSIDLTTTEHDIRLKAEKNLHLLAGNDSKGSGQGGILLESRSSSMNLDFSKVGEETISGGIVFKAKKSDIVGWAQNIYYGTKSIDGGTAGRIMLSADEGKTDIIFKGNNIYRDIGESAIDRFSQERANIFTETTTIFDTGTMIIRGDGFFTRGASLWVDDNIGSGKNVIVEKSVIAGDSVSYGGTVPTLLPGNSGASRGIVPPLIITADNQAETIENVYEGIVQLRVDEFEAGDDKIGSKKTAEDTLFSLRSSDDYDMKDFKLFLSRWQQLLKDSGNEWEEKEVKTGAGPTYPFPGREAYEGSDAFYPDAPFKYFDMKIGYANARDSGVYAERTNMPPPSPASLNTYISTVPVQA